MGPESFRRNNDSAQRRPEGSVQPDGSGLEQVLEALLQKQGGGSASETEEFRPELAANLPPAAQEELREALKRVQ
jgi:hypothetical protein